MRAPQRFTDDPARGPCARRRAGRARALSARQPRRAGALAAAGYPRARLRDPVALRGRHPAADLKRDRRSDLHRARSSAATRSRRSRRSSRACTCSACRTARRSRSRTWRCSCWAICSSTCCAKQRRELNILGATSGDTGSAAEYAMRGKRGIHVFMLSPHGQDERRSRRAQMYSLQDAEHPQPRGARRVRRLPGHRQGGQRATPRSRRATASARSTRSTGRASWRRWSTTSRAISRRRSSDGEQVSFAVPSGNFGNIFAGHVARAMGLPIRQPDPRHQRERRARRVLPHRPLPRAHGGETHATSSPSMDISKASNFERFVFDLVGRDPAVVRDLWQRDRARRRVRSGRDRALVAACRDRVRVRARARTPTGSRRSGDVYRELRRDHRPAHRRRRQGRARAPRGRACR